MEIAPNAEHGTMVAPRPNGYGESMLAVTALNADLTIAQRVTKYGEKMVTPMVATTPNQPEDSCLMMSFGKNFLSDEIHKIPAEICGYLPRYFSAP